MEIRYATISKTGRRHNNEDVFKVVDTPDCDSKVKLACKKASRVSDQKAYELHYAEMGTTMVMISMAPDILQARMMDDKPLEDILDVYDFLCEKQGDDNYTSILIECV